MEHEVFVPVPAEALRQTLRDPARVARCVPGLQQDAEASAGPLSGRLKVRIGSHTITYRGALTLAGADDHFTAEGTGTEVRGTGSAKLTLTVRLTATDGGTTLVFTGGSQADGRLADLPPTAKASAARRLLERFAARLVEESARPAVQEPGPPPSAEAADARPDNGPGPEDAAGSAPDAAAPEDRADRAHDAPVTGGGADPTVPGGFEEPPEPLEGETFSAEGDFVIPDEPPDLPDDEPPAEAAHARRSMIGRSAEEVDHAPPRGRYAPVPAPEVAGAGATLRWVAPAAALALASAVVVGRALRRRR